ncbi:MAG: DUF3304 domain-containing protein [Pseudomonadota bacterium]
MVLVAPLIVACSKPVPVSIHGVNYTVEPFSYVLTDPNDPKNTGGGELIESYAAGGTMCCYELPRKWQPGMKVSVRLAHWEGKLADDSLRQIVSTHLLDVPRYENGKPGELWVLRLAGGSIDLISSDVQPNHRDWPGQVKGWPIPSVAYKRERWQIEFDQLISTLKIYERSASQLMSSPDDAAKEEWDTLSEYQRTSLAGFSGPQDSAFRKKMQRDNSEGIVRVKERLKQLEKRRP